jgi:Protein of unknown function (DUF2946)
MRTGLKRVLSVVAIAAIALHTAVWSGTNTRASAAVDPFSVICHSGGGADGIADEAPTSPVPAPSHACDHCNLCPASGPTAVPVAAIPICLLPTLLLQELAPVSVVVAAGFEISLKRARGPPTAA